MFSYSDSGLRPASAAARRRLYLFSPLPPQRNGLADYIVEYLPMLAGDFDLCLVAEGGRSAEAAASMAGSPFRVIDEAGFLATPTTHPSGDELLLVPRSLSVFKLSAGSQEHARTTSWKLHPRTRQSEQ